ncbi:hypothetical protein QBC46DRAFT_5944 [Diplogelasinospora grovesii]|uniref:Secreted protein n=1 Tax=Diplogelasinospora grovesii TaxID=303347 RepID=A0AAN6NJW2_9PEZI|nr:hypothetical protein QBC46DRAFT_5944 [Diplogelasinospora grovesii]
MPSSRPHYILLCLLVLYLGLSCSISLKKLARREELGRGRELCLRCHPYTTATVKLAAHKTCWSCQINAVFSFRLATPP